MDENRFLNKILDRINKFGINSLTDIEKDFLIAYASEDEEQMNLFINEDKEKTFESSDKIFTFKLSKINKKNKKIYYYGIITIKNIALKGYILEVKNHLVPCFENETNDIFDFCEGIEYELDSFLDYVIFTIKDEKII